MALHLFRGELVSTASPAIATPATPPMSYTELRPAAQIRSAGWFIRRAVIGIFALTIFVTGGAWLLHASIEPDASQPVEQSEAAN